jgi:hypothetical protein
VASPEQNKQLVQEAFDTLVNRRDYTPGRDDLFNLIKSLPETLRPDTEVRRADSVRELPMFGDKFSNDA